MKIVILAVVVIVAITLVMAALCMWLWNWVMPDIFGLPEINLLQAAALMALSSLFFYRPRVK